MKKALLLALAFVALSLNAKVITLNLQQEAEGVTFDENGLWVERFQGEANTFSYGIFTFSHYGTIMKGSYEYEGEIIEYETPYCEGFSVSKSTATDFQYYGLSDWNNAVGKGQLGDAFLMVYDGGAWAYAPKTLTFNDGNAYTPKEVYLCNAASVLTAVKEGTLAPARKFEKGDYFTVTFNGLDKEGNKIEGSEVVCYLIDYRSEDEAAWKLNEGWERFDLSALGEVYGITYTVNSTDVGEYGINTPTYFAMDALAVDNGEAEYFLKHPFDGSNWEWKALEQEDGLWVLNSTWGGVGVNINTKADDADAQWFPAEQIAGLDNVTVGSEVKFIYNAELNTMAVELTGEPVEPVAEYFIKHPWGTGLDADWTWKPLAKVAEGVYEIEDLWGGVGVNINTVASDQGAQWIPAADIAGAAELKIGAQIRFVYNATAKTVAVELTTALPAVLQDKENTSKKVMIDGKLYIVTTRGVFNQLGQEVR